MTDLRDIGRALYGDWWQSPLARDLGVSPRTMRRWVAGTTPLPEGVKIDLVDLVRKRIKLLHTLI